MTGKFAVALFSLLTILYLSGNLVAAPSTLSSQTLPDKNEIEITLVTFSPYHEIFTWFGHTAIEIRNQVTGKSYMFNFGGFFFDLEHLLQFTFGKFIFWSFALESDQALLPYQMENRQMVFQTLNLTHRQKTDIQRQLLDSMKPANRYYLYDHFRNNCSTKIRDIIDHALGGDLKRQASTPTELTYRDYVHRMTVGEPLLDFLLMLYLNDEVDKPITDWDSMFLPDRLMAVVQNSYNPLLDQTRRAPLVKVKKDINLEAGFSYFSAKATAANTIWREIVWGIFLLAIFGLSAIFYIKRNRFFRKLYPGLVSIFALVFGSLGVILFFMMCFTNHKDTFWNENILLINPLTFILLPSGIAALLGKYETIFQWISIASGLTAVLAILLKLLPNFDQANGQQLRVLLPALLAIGVAGAADKIINKRLVNP